MKYLGPKFSVAMPGAKVQSWPFDKKPLGYDPMVGTCTRCFGIMSTRYEPHTHGSDAKRPRKRICFG